MNQIFLKFNGDSLDTGPNYMKNLLSENSLLDEKIEKIFFLGRTFFRIRFLNRIINESKLNISTNKKNEKNRYIIKFTFFTLIKYL